MKHTEEINEKKQHQEWKKISEELEFAVNKSYEWKPSGMDKIPNFWISSLYKGYEKLASLLSEIVESPDAAPKWLSEGITYILPKTKDTENPQNYRPITCLTTTYKLLTSILAERTYTFMENNNTFPLKQKGCTVKEVFMGVKNSCS